MSSKCQRGLIVATNADKSEVIYTLMEPFHRHCRFFLIIFLTMQLYPPLNWVRIEGSFSVGVEAGWRREGVEGRCGKYSIWQRGLTSWKHNRRLVQLRAVPPWRASWNSGMQSSRWNGFGRDAMQRSKRKRGSERLLVRVGELVSKNKIR